MKFLSERIVKGEILLKSYSCSVCGLRTIAFRDVEDEDVIMNNHHIQLTPEIVRTIRETERVHGSGVALAKQYGVTKTTISLIRSRRIWKGVE